MVSVIQVLINLLIFLLVDLLLQLCNRMAFHKNKSKSVLSSWHHTIVMLMLTPWLFLYLPLCTLISPSTIVNRQISDDFKMAALRLKAHGRDSVWEILQIVQFSRKTFNQAQRRYHLTGTVAKAQVISRGWPWKALHEDVQYLIRLAHHKPTLFLDEYQQRLKVYWLLSLSMATIHHEFQQAGLSIKWFQKMAAERDSMKRADFVQRISQYPATYLLPLDEVSKDDRTYARLWGRSEVGTHVEACQPFVHKRRFSMLATMALDEGIIAAQVVEGSFTCDLFLPSGWPGLSYS